MTANDLCILDNEENLTRFWEKIVVDTKDPNGCWQYLAHRDKNGCGKFWLKNNDGKWVSLRAPRLMWILETEQDIPEGMQVQHTCDNEECTNPKHLKLGTPKDNAIDMMLRGRNDNVQKGERHFRAKLTNLNNKKVKKICDLYYIKHVKIHIIAKQFKVKSHVVGSIVRGKSWKHFTKSYINKYQGQYAKNKERNEIMYQMLKSGHTFKQIAKKFKLDLDWTRDLLRQIRKAKGDPTYRGFKSGRKK